jgi:predicted hotdog family 3-hydroxylacyl-ACP dehydratase
MLSENILEFVPQRHPFVMVDVLLFANKETATTKFIVTKENVFCENDFFSEAGLLENIAQTVAAGNGYNEQQVNKKTSGGYIAGVKNFEVFVLPKINDVLTTEIIVTGKIFNMTSIAGKILLGDVLAAQCEMKIFSNSGE